MTKPISLKKHIHPGVVVGVVEGINTGYYWVQSCEENQFAAMPLNMVNMHPINFAYNTPNMTIYQRISDNNLPF